MMPVLLASVAQVFFGSLMFITALFLILIVLVQRGKGGGLAGAFGGMGGQSAFGTKAGDTFTRVTIGVAFFWIVLCVAAVKVLSGPAPIEDAPVGGAISGPAVPGEEDPAKDPAATPETDSAPATDTPATAPPATDAPAADAPPADPPSADKPADGGGTDEGADKAPE